MQSAYLILKKLPSPSRDVFLESFPIPTAADSISGAQGISTDVVTVRRDEVRVIAEDPNTVAIAPVMPMSLVVPLPASPQAQEKRAWGLGAVGADKTTFTGEGIVVAVLDTGIDAAHPAFAGVDLVQRDFTGEGNGDFNGHGTHCAGTIFGRPVNGIPIGVAPGVKKALIGKVLDKNGNGSSDAIVNAVLWAVDEGANVISISIGMDFPGYVRRMVEAKIPPELATSRALEAYRANIRLFDRLSALIASKHPAAQPSVIVAAAGNESRRELGPEYEIGVSPPAVSEGIISVGALQEIDGKYSVADFSNTGPNVSAPGFDVLSAAPGGGVRTLSGTSMATPHVAGVLALWAQKLKAAGALNSFLLVAKLAGSASAANMAAADPVDYGAGMVQCP